MNVKPEFSSSDLVLALAIVNGTAAEGALRITEADAKAAHTEREELSSRAGMSGRTTGHAG